MYLNKTLPYSHSGSCLSKRQGAAKETERAVLKYGERVPQDATKYFAKSHDSANSYAVGQDMATRGAA